MLATPGTQPAGEEWVHEVKWDGMRVLADVSDGAVRLRSRSGRDVTATFPELATLADTVPDALIDGEIIALSEGIPSFAALAERMHVADARRARELAAVQPITVMAFDLMRLYGVDLLKRPLAERRASLDKIELPDEHWNRSPSYVDGPALLDATERQGLEGVVSKRLASTYQPGRRSPDWIKVAHRHHQSGVVGGWRPETNSSGRVGSLLIGVPDAQGRLHFSGRVGSGIDGTTQRALLAEFGRLAADVSPFADPVPVLDARGTHYVQPEIVVEVRHLGWTPGGRLRQPVFRGVRADLSAGEVRREP
jgi:bifunctional non-homologous end joining protein LigD